MGEKEDTGILIEPPTPAAVGLSLTESPPRLLSATSLKKLTRGRAEVGVEVEAWILSRAYPRPPGSPPPPTSWRTPCRWGASSQMSQPHTRTLLLGWPRSALSHP